MNNRKHIKKKHHNYLNIILFFGSILAGLFLSNHFNQLYFTNNSHESAETDAKKAINECAKSTYIPQCYADFFVKLTNKTDIVYASSVIQSLVSLAPDSSLNCHILAHKVSQTEFQKDPKKWKSILKKVSITDCMGGYLHGTLEAHMGQEPNFIISSETIKSVCDGLDLYNEIHGIGCVHGMGHLLLVQNDGNLPKTVEECSKLDIIPNDDCLMGTFMEYIMGTNLLDHGIIKEQPKLNEKRASEIEKQCNKYSGTAADACWRQISTIYASISFDDSEKIYEHCQNATEKNLINNCFNHGIGIISNRLLSDSTRFFKICQVFDQSNPLFGDCMKSTISSVLLNSSSKTDALTTFCAKTYLNYQRSCFDYIIVNLKKVNASSEVFKKTCKDISKNNLPAECGQYLTLL